MVKNYVVDTNVLLSNPHAIFGFEDNNVWITGTTLQELDSKKTQPGELGYNAREAGRILEDFRKKGNFLEGIPIGNGGTLYVEPDGCREDLLPAGFSLSVPDNRIISSALYLKNEKRQGEPVILLTNDSMMRVNASVCGLDSEEVLNDIVKETKGYTGHIELKVEDYDMIPSLYKDGAVAFQQDGMYENEFVTLHCGNQSALSIYHKGLLKLVKEQTLFGGVKPLNKFQTYAMYALMSDVPLVILSGPAGTAKTFLTLAAGLSQTYFHSSRRNEEKFERILISRPNVEAGNGQEHLGALPGGIEEKLQPLMNSYYDNLNTLFRDKNDGENGIAEARQQVDDLLASGTIEITPLSYIRGRSIRNSFIICDEAQNAGKNLIRDIISRCGSGSRVIIAGDPTQIDVPTLNKHNNGLVYAAEGMKGSPLCCYLKFSEDQCVRSPLAEEAIRRLR